MPTVVVTDERSPHLGGNIEGGDPLTYSYRVWEALVWAVNPRNVLDAGCGEGHALDWFIAHGVHATGFDGLKRNVDVIRKSYPFNASVCDLSMGPYKPEFKKSPCFDLCWCCELVEHVEERHVMNIVETFRLCRFVAMTHATPGQTGWHHVNCQTGDYWRALLEGNGFNYLPDLTEKCRSVAGETYFKGSGLVFSNVGAS